MKIAIRLDDITPGMDRQKSGRFFKLLEEYEVKPVIGVVPDCRDPKLAIDPPQEDFWQWVLEREASGWVIAMHGCYHVYTTKEGGLFPLNRQSEFAGIPFEQQNAMIRHGVEEFAKHGISTDLFMAPAHSYDIHTLRALRENNFTKITDGFGYSPYRYEGLVFYPIAASRRSALQAEVTNANTATGMHRASKRNTENAVTTFVTHTNVMSDNEYRFFEQLFKTRRQDVIDYSEMLRMPAQETGSLHRTQEYLEALGKRTAVSILKSIRG